MPIAVFRKIWNVLDKIYLVFGLFQCFMVSILLIIIVQMVARWTGFTFEGSTEFAGYAMAATSFLLWHMRCRGVHIPSIYFPKSEPIYTKMVRFVCVAGCSDNGYLLCAFCVENKFYVRNA